MTAICYVDDGYVDEFTIKFRFSISNKVLQLFRVSDNIPVKKFVKLQHVKQDSSG